VERERIGYLRFLGAHGLHGQVGLAHAPEGAAAVGECAVPDGRPVGLEVGAEVAVITFPQFGIGRAGFMQMGPCHPIPECRSVAAAVFWGGVQASEQRAVGDGSGAAWLRIRLQCDGDVHGCSPHCRLACAASQTAWLSCGSESRFSRGATLVAPETSSPAPAVGSGDTTPRSRFVLTPTGRSSFRVELTAHGASGPWCYRMHSTGYILMLNHPSSLMTQTPFSI
jgi:hypothetical protein